MAAMTTLSVRHHYWDDSPALRSWAGQEQPGSRSSWTPRSPARPKRLRKTECREVFTSDTESHPTIHIHGCACRCNQIQTENEVQDALLAAKITSLSQTLLATNHPVKPACSRHSHNHSNLPQPKSKTFGQRSGRSSLRGTNSILSTLTRLFSPPPSTTRNPNPHQQLQADLCIGCADLDIDKVARYLVPLDDADAPRVAVNAPNHLGMTPLMAAVRSPAAGARPKAHLAMVRFLVECCGADVDATRVDRVTGAGESVLSMACEMGMVEVVRYLVRRGVVVDRRLPFGREIGKGGEGPGRGQTALHIAVLAERVECVEVLVKEGRADVNLAFDAAESGARAVKGLRGKPRSVTREGRRVPRHPVSALHLAHGSVSCTRVLLRCGAKVNAKDAYGRMPLHWAAEAGNAGAVRLLIGAGADVNAAAADGTTSIGAAVASLDSGEGKEEHVEVLRVLLGGETRPGVRNPRAEALKGGLLGLQDSDRQVAELLA